MSSRSSSATPRARARCSTARPCRSTTPSCARRRPRRCAPGLGDGAASAPAPAVGELRLAAGGACSARRRRLRPPHVLVRPVGLRQDLLARRRARAAAARDRPAHRHARPELRLRRASASCARASTRRWRSATRAAARGVDRPPRRARARTACACASRARPAGRRRRRCGSTRSPTARSTPSSTALLDDERPEHSRSSSRSTRRGARARAARAQSRRRPLGRVGARRPGLGARRARRPGRALPRRRPRLARHARGAGGGGRGGARARCGTRARGASRC